MKQIDAANYLATLATRRQPYHDGYYAMCSSVLDGIVTDPLLMQLPVDDHLVHRGDGVFDTCKCVAGAIYNLDAHLTRLERSAAAIGIRWAAGMKAVSCLAVETTRAGGRPDCCVRIVLARGPGGFSVNPYESPAPALYIVVYAINAPFMRRHPAGGAVRRSTIPAKPAAMAEIKNCNYLPNVLMKREAVDWGVDFVVGYDADGHLTEGATENVGLVTRDGELAFPRLENILAGTTMLRLAELAHGLTRTGELRAVSFRDIGEHEVRQAAEFLAVGTTINVAALCSYEGQPIGSGRPGTVWQRLETMLDDDIRKNQAMRTPVFGEGQAPCSR